MITSSECYVNCKKKVCVDKPGFCKKLFKLDELYKNTLLSYSQRKHQDLFIDADGTDLDKFKQLKEIEKNIESFVSNGNNLFIHSTQVGNGKTAWSIRMIQSYLNQIWWKSDLSCRALFISVPRLLMSLKDNIEIKNEYIEFIKQNIFVADLVVWDEIGAKPPSQFELDNLMNMINTRVDLGKSNIYTSNLTEEQLCDIMGSRLYSRIVNLSTNIELHGTDKRGLNR